MAIKSDKLVNRFYEFLRHSTFVTHDAMMRHHKLQMLIFFSAIREILTLFRDTVRLWPNS